MTACFDNAGIRFLYPENWRITEEKSRSSPLSISVQSPGSGFWSLMVYEPDIKPDDLLQQVLESMRQEYGDVECLPVAEQFQDANSAGYEMCFYYLDFLVSCRALATRAQGKTLLIIWQAEDREFERLEPVFRAMTTSLFQNRRVC